MSTLPSYARYIVGDTRDVVATLPDGSIDLVLTSPPFLALRSYLPGDHPDKGREIGSEPSPAAFLRTLLELTADWRRVLAPHGSIAVELGDSYSGSSGSGGDYAVGGKKDGGGPPMEYVEEVWELRSYRFLVVLPYFYSCEVGECDEDAVGWRAPTPRRPWRQACKKHGGIDYDTLHYPDSEGEGQ